MKASGSMAAQFAQVMKQMAEASKSAEATCRIAARQARQIADYFDSSAYELQKSWAGLEELMGTKKSEN